MQTSLVRCRKSGGVLSGSLWAPRVICSAAAPMCVLTACGFLGVVAVGVCCRCGVTQHFHRNIRIVGVVARWRGLFPLVASGAENVVMSWSTLWCSDARRSHLAPLQPSGEVREEASLSPSNVEPPKPQSLRYVKVVSLWRLRCMSHGALPHALWPACCFGGLWVAGGGALARLRSRRAHKLGASVHVACVCVLV